MIKKPGKSTIVLSALLIILLAVSCWTGTDAAQAKSKVKMSASKAKIYEGYTKKVTLKGAKAKKVKWKSSNRKIATVSKNGIIKAKKSGKCIITAKYQKKSYKCRVTVKKLSLSEKSLYTHPGDSNKITLKGAKGKIKWSTSDGNVAVVSSKGIITGSGEGNCIITATHKKKSYKCKVRVVEKEINGDLQARDNVVVISEQGMGSSAYEKMMDSIISVEEDGSNEDAFMIRVSRDSPLATYINEGSIETGDVIYLPEGEYNVLPMAMVLEGYSQSKGYSRSGGEVDLFMRKACLDEIVMDDIHQEAFALNPDDPVAFTWTPGTGVSNMKGKDKGESDTVIGAGFQLQNLNNLQLNQSGSLSSTGLKISLSAADDIIIYDKDGKKKTENDQVLFSADTGIKDITPDYVMDWDNGINKAPDQIRFVMNWTEYGHAGLKFNPGIDMEDLIKKGNEMIMGPDQFGSNKLLGVELNGIDYMKKGLILGAVGLNLSTRQPVLGARNIQNASEDAPFSVYAVILFTMDVSGEVSATVSLSLDKTKVRMAGMNLQKAGYCGTHGTVAENKGDTRIIVDAGRNKYYLDAYNPLFQSNPNDSLKLTASAEGNTSANLGVGMSAGLMLGGVMPDDVHVMLVGVKGSLKGEGSISYDFLQKKAEADADLSLSLGLYSSVQARFNMKFKKPLSGTKEIKAETDKLEKVWNEFKFPTPVELEDADYPNLLSGELTKEETEKLLAYTNLYLGYSYDRGYSSISRSDLDSRLDCNLEKTGGSSIMIYTEAQKDWGKIPLDQINRWRRFWGVAEYEKNRTYEEGWVYSDSQYLNFNPAWGDSLCRTSVSITKAERMGKSLQIHYKMTVEEVMTEETTNQAYVANLKKGSDNRYYLSDIEME